MQERASLSACLHLLAGTLPCLTALAAVRAAGPAVPGDEALHPAPVRVGLRAARRLRGVLLVHRHPALRVLLHPEEGRRVVHLRGAAPSGTARSAGARLHTQLPQVLVPPSSAAASNPAHIPMCNRSLPSTWRHACAVGPDAGCCGGGRRLQSHASSRHASGMFE